MDEDDVFVRRGKKPRKIMTVKPSSMEATEAVRANKLYWGQVFTEMDKTYKTPTDISESRHISKVLPNDLYHKVCNTLGIPIVPHAEEEPKKESKKLPRRLLKKPLITYRTTLYVDREMDSDTDVELQSSDGEEHPNIHLEFLSKPEREQITWPTRYLQPEREDEKTLVKKADDLTDRIAQEFCNYMKEMGGDQQSQLFTPKAIKELFQIEFDTHASRSLRVVPKELPSVDEKIANITGLPEKSSNAVIEREVLRDIRAENRPDKLKAFNQSLPRREQWRAPKNDTKNLWRSARHVPKDLVTLKTVWEGITNLRSVKEYCRWMIDHPEYRRAPYLKSLGMFDPAVLEARYSLEVKSALTPPLVTSAADDDIPASVQNIRRRLSQLADAN